MKDSSSGTRALVHELYESRLSGGDIESKSFAYIDSRAERNGFSASEWTVVQRLIHTTGDLSLGMHVRFSDDAISAGVAALREKAPIYVDASMAKAGLSTARLKSVNGEYDREDIISHIADEDVAAEAKEQGLPRSVFALRKARKILDGAIVAIGNAPTAVLELNRLIIEDGVRPALVIGMPVGFVHVEECKRELESLGIPYITIQGRRGGSPCTVAAIHALCRESVNPSESTEGKSDCRWESGSYGVIILGHGSRRPGAAHAMEQVAERLRNLGRYADVRIGFMAQAKPAFADAVSSCGEAGIGRIMVLPYFLHEGMHRAYDIPKLMHDVAGKFPNLELKLGKTLGYDDILVDLVIKRISESLSTPDIRELPMLEESEFVEGTGHSHG